MGFSASLRCAKCGMPFDARLEPGVRWWRAERPLLPGSKPDANCAEPWTTMLFSIAGEPVARGIYTLTLEGETDLLVCTACDRAAAYDKHRDPKRRPQ